ncbi:hypothetical protein SEUCBS139899_009120 [Sporothrix eucalyptigena]
MVESKCIEVDNKQSANNDPLEDDHWQALLALHRTLLHEHHDFMLASQHPSASPALRRVAQKYAMPARMWRHGIHSFLELLRHRLPASREHMITFIYMAYSIIALLYETVRAFEDTWVECLGDLSRYRMAIEDDNQRARDAWTVVSRRCATEGDDGARPVPSADKPVTLPARDTVTKDSTNPWATPAPLLRGRRDEGPAVVDPEILKVMEPVQKLVTQIDQVVFARVGDANCHGYIHARLVWMLCMARLPEGIIYVEHGFPWQELVKTLNKMMRTCENIERVEQDVFMQPQVDRKAEEERKIRDIQFRQQQQQQARDEAGDKRLFVPTEPLNVDIPLPPPARSDEDKPLPDDWFLRGLLWSEYNFPQGWFANMESIDDDERLMESDSTRMTRKERVLWMACRLAQYKTWITYNATTHEFQVAEVDEQKEVDKLTGSDLKDNKVQAGAVGDEADENSAGDTTLDYDSDSKTVDFEKDG